MLSELKWIVIPGGPGLSNIYLKFPLKRMRLNYKLIFYHMHGAPESKNKNPSIDEMVDQIHQVANANSLGKYGLITHSFGNYLALQALQLKRHCIEAIIMLNPMPFEFHAWKSALAYIEAKIPKTILNEVMSLSASNDLYDGIKLFKLIFSYYTASRNTHLPIDVPFDASACNAIESKIPEYNDKIFITSTSIPIVQIVGEKDPFFNDYDIFAEKTIVLSNVGHYPFFEDPDNFCNAMKKAGKMLCQ